MTFSSRKKAKFERFERPDGPTPSQLGFYPSSLEHRPLVPSELAMLDLYLDDFPAENNDVLAHWDRFHSEEGQHLEKWIWGLRFFGREVMVKAALIPLVKISTIWDKLYAQHPDAVICESVSSGLLSPPGGLCNFGQSWLNKPGGNAIFSIVELGEVYEGIEVDGDAESGLAEAFWAMRSFVGVVTESRDHASFLSGTIALNLVNIFNIMGFSNSEAVTQVRELIRNEMKTWIKKYMVPK